MLIISLFEKVYYILHDESLDLVIIMFTKEHW